VVDKKKPKKLAGYKYIITYAGFLDVYGKGDERVMVDRRTGEIVLTYDIRNIPGKQDERG